MTLSKRIFKTKTNNRKQLGWAFGFVLSCMNMFAQDGINEERLPRARFEKRWDRYEKVMSRGGNSFISYYFRDTVSIDEMVEAFRTNKEKHYSSSTYAGHDSIVHGIFGPYVMLNSPLKNCPVKEAQTMRGVWVLGPSGIALQGVQDPQGNMRPEIMEKVEKKPKDWRKGDYVLLRNPMHYMGYVVSPCAVVQTRDENRLVGSTPTIQRPADFFSSQGSRSFDGDWDSGIKGGGEVFGKYLTFYGAYNPCRYSTEKVFSVLLYQKPESSSTKKEYTLKLLEPENPDEMTEEAFKVLKDFVENLQYNAFNPLYTTDYRYFLGRYYRVTVNKCGWLLEDYMTINRK